MSFMIDYKILNDIKEFITGSNNFSYHELALTSCAYPLDLDFTLINEVKEYCPKDKNNIPLMKYRSVGIQYNPTRIAAFALAHFNRYLKHQCPISKNIFIRMAEWFLRSEDGLWMYEFDWDDLRAPWISAMAQGEGISVLCRAYSLTKNKKFIDKAILAAKPFSRYIEEGGVRSKIFGKWEFLEEYPTKNPNYTLNGFLYALIGISDLVNIVHEEREKTGYDSLIDTLKANLELWDLSYWSAYDLHNFGTRNRNPATASYHRLHITLLKYLGQKLCLNELIDIANRWELYHTSIFNRLRALVNKISYRLEVIPSR
jgi:hypothetical protein